MNKKTPVIYKKYRMTKLFQVTGTHPYSKSKKEILDPNGKNPVISNSTLNMGIIGYSNLPPTNKGNVITFSDTVKSYQTILYRKIPFIGYQHLKKLVPNQNYFNRFNKYIGIYIATAISRSIHNKYDYSMKYNKDRQNETIIQLPTKNNKLDLKHMENIVYKNINYYMGLLYKKISKVLKYHKII